MPNGPLSGPIVSRNSPSPAMQSTGQVSVKKNCRDCYVDSDLPGYLLDVEVGSILDAGKSQQLSSENGRMYRLIWAGHLGARRKVG